MSTRDDDRPDPEETVLRQCPGCDGTWTAFATGSSRTSCPHCGFRLGEEMEDEEDEIVGRCEGCGKQIMADEDYAFTERGVPVHLACATNGPLYNTQGDNV